MKYNVLGKTGLKVSEIGFGAWPIGGNIHDFGHSKSKDEESIAAVKKALEMGCTFFDTADIYGRGHSEEILGLALKDVRDDVIISTKVGWDFYSGSVKQSFDPDYIEFAIKKSIERLQTSSIDLLQLHNPSTKQLEDGRVFEKLMELQQEGLIRHVGISITFAQEGISALDIMKPASIQLVYNLLNQMAGKTLIPRAVKEEIGVIAREPLANGFLSGKYDVHSNIATDQMRETMPRSFIARRAQQAEEIRAFLKHRDETLAQLAIKFCVSNPDVATVIPGIKTSIQAEENMATSGIPNIENQDLKELNALAVSP